MSGIRLKTLKKLQNDCRAETISQVFVILHSQLLCFLFIYVYIFTAVLLKFVTQINSIDWLK